jgi:transglutaminase-like putative cysteine protease
VGVGLVYLQLHRRLARRHSRDDRLAIAVATLMMVVAGSRTEALPYLAAFVGWGIGAPMALLPLSGSRHGDRERGLLAAAVLLGGVALFWVIPRPPRVEPIHPGMGLTGFSPEVELGDLDALLDDTSEVFTVTARPAISEPVYLRGVALDQFDGKRWRSSAEPQSTSWQVPSVSHVVLEVHGGPADQEVLFTAGRVAAVEADRTLRRDAHGALFSQVRPDRYVVHTAPPFGPSALPVDSDMPQRAYRYETLPDGLSDQVRQLATQVAGGPGTPPNLAIGRVADHLQRTHRYSRRPADRGEEAPLDRFLLDRGQGHCEYFASSAAILLRAVGVPTRLVNGFRVPGGAEMVVRRHHAHAWIEAWIEGTGWVIVDATPAQPTPTLPQPGLLERIDSRWQRVVALDASDQRQLLTRPAGLALVLTSVAGLLALLLLLVRLRPGSRSATAPRATKRVGPATQAHRKARAAIAAAGWRIPPWLPPVEAARWYEAHAGGAGAALQELAWLAYRESLLGAGVDSDRARELVGMAQAKPEPES